MRFDVRLTDEQVEQFHTEGYTWVPRITTDEELGWVRPIYDALFGVVEARALVRLA